MAGDGILKIETRGRVRFLRLNRPERRKALSLELGNAISKAVMSADADKSIYPIAITGAGTKLTYTRAFNLPLSAGIPLDTWPDVYASEDRKEGARALLEKRAPMCEGR